MRGQVILMHLSSLLVALLLGAFPALAQQSRPDPKILIVTQTVASREGGSTSTVDARVASVNSRDGTRGAGQFGVSVPEAAAIASLAVMDFGANVRRSELLARARNWILPQANALTTAMSGYMRANHLASATYTLNQPVQVHGVSSVSRLTWTAMVDEQGRALFGDPTIAADTPTLLHVVYVPKALLNGLPNAWRYPDAGILTWWLADERLQPLSGPTRTDTDGAFDEPASGLGPVDPDQGVKCLADKAVKAACPRAYPDVRALLDATGAPRAVLDYVRRLSAVYDTTATGSARARVAVRVDLRQLSYSDCGPPRFEVAGTLGVSLQRTVDRYVVPASGVPALLNRYVDEALSPTQAFRKSRTVSRALAEAMDPWLIDPSGAGVDLVNVSDIQTISYLAPISYAGSLSSTLATGQDDTTVATLTCARDGSILARAEIRSDKQVHSGPSNSSYYAVESTFLPARPQTTAGFCAVTYEGRPWDRVELRYDGQRTVTVTTDTTCNRWVCEDTFGGANCGMVGQPCRSSLQLVF